MNKNTELLRNGVKSAIEIVREGGMHPVEILMEMSRFLRTVGVALAPKGGDAAALQAAVLEMAKTEGGRKQLETMRCRESNSVPGTQFYRTSLCHCPNAASAGASRWRKSSPLRGEHNVEIELNFEAKNETAA